MDSIKLIENEIEYEAALAKAAYFFDSLPALGSEEAEKFESLLGSIEIYESINYPM